MRESQKKKKLRSYTRWIEEWRRTKLAPLIMKNERRSGKYKRITLHAIISNVVIRLIDNKIKRVEETHNFLCILSYVEEHLVQICSTGRRFPTRQYKG